MRAYWVAWIDKEAGTYFRKTENLAESALLEANKQAYNDSEGKRWGDGQVAARVPLNVLYQGELAKKIKEGDRDHMRWWLNHEQARPYRTFKGRV